MSFGERAVKATKPPPPAPTTIAPEVSASQESFREKWRRMRGRESTRLVSPGFLVPEPKKSGLSATLG